MLETKSDIGYALVVYKIIVYVSDFNLRPLDNDWAYDNYGAIFIKSE